MWRTRHQQGWEKENNMGLINVKRIQTSGLLLILILLGLGSPRLLTNHSVSFAQGRGQLAQASRNYELGFQAGRQDARRNLSNNYLRHRRQFNARWEPEFRDGYENGYADTFDRGYSLRDSTRMATVTMATMIRVLPGLTVMAEGRMVTRLLGR